VTLDVSNNPGGVSVLAYLTHYLLTGIALSNLATPWDMRYRKEIQNFFNCNLPGSNSFCFNVTSGAPFKGTTFFTDRNNWRRVVRGRTIDLHSGLFSLFDENNATNAQNLQTIFSVLFTDSKSISTAISLVNSLPTPRPFTQIQILSNGFCVSTCSIMSSMFHFVPPTPPSQVKFVQYGGIPGSLMDSSVASANVIEIPNIIVLPFRELLIPSNTNLTRQFNRYPPDVVLPIWLSTGSNNTLAIWQLSFNLFT